MKPDKVAIWMGYFVEQLLKAHPELSGRIDWSAATYYFLYGKTVEDAVFEYCMARGLA